jgi:hypothetical protein
MITIVDFRDHSCGFPDASAPEDQIVSTCLALTVAIRSVIEEVFADLYVFGREATAPRNSPGRTALVGF